MDDINNPNELNLDQLDNVTGGTKPRYPSGADKNLVNSKEFLNNVLDNIPKIDGNQPRKAFDTCPKCHSTAISFNKIENICMCQDCGYCEDYSK